MQDPQWCLKQAKQVGLDCHRLIRRLFSHKVLDNLRAAQGVISLGKKYGSTRLEAACSRAGHEVPGWVEFNPSELNAKVVSLPTSDQIPFDVNMNFIVEFYR